MGVTRSAQAISDQALRYTLVQIDSIFVGVVASGATFLPVFLVRLGASGTEVGLLTAIPALVAFAMAVPLGRWLQGRRNIVPWYSRLRLVGWSSYAVIAVSSALLPTNVAVPAILGIWAVASVPSVAGLVAFPIVMDGAAGPQGRFDLLGRRWAVSGVVTSLTVVLTGQALVTLSFPANFEAFFVTISLAGVGSFAVSRRIILPEHRQAPPSVAESARARIRAPIDLVRANRSFSRFELRSLVYTASTGLAMPLLPLLYVRDLQAPNSSDRNHRGRAVGGCGNRIPRRSTGGPTPERSRNPSPRAVCSGRRPGNTLGAEMAPCGRRDLVRWRAGRCQHPARPVR